MTICHMRRSSVLLNKFYEYASKDINEEYIKDMFHDKNNRIIAHSINPLSHTENEITTLIVYRKTIQSYLKQRFVIILFLVHPLIRNYGYGTIAMNEFIQYSHDYDKITEIVLHSVESSFIFYKKFGFKPINPTTFLKTYENLDDTDNLCFSLIV